MNYSTLLAALLVTASLAACDKPTTVNVPPPTVGVPGPAGPQGNTGSTGSTGIKQRIVLKGELPSPLNPPTGCVFSTRCPHVTDRCRAERPKLRDVAERQVACHYAENFLIA